MKNHTPYQAVYEFTRGDTVESIHFGAMAVVDVHGRLITSLGDPYGVTFLRSTAKPFQALPFIEEGGHGRFGLSLREVALLCASHSGTDEHAATVEAIQAKTGVLEADLMCGTHPVFDGPTAEALRQRGEKPTPNRHNCSGKHTGMLASARLNQLPTGNYLDFDHPIQQRILRTFAEMCRLPIEQVSLGIDGCSAPNFAVPLFNAALAFARLCDPRTAADLSPQRAAACDTISEAMRSHPEMVGGPNRFDTRLMKALGSKLLSKGGAEGFQGIGLLPGALGPGSPGVGIALKISDGDPQGRAGHAVSLAVLSMLGVVQPDELVELSDYRPEMPVYNWRKITVGQARPSFDTTPVHLPGSQDTEPG